MIVYCCADLIFGTKIRSAAEAIGLAARPARDPAMLRARLDRMDDGKGNEIVTLLFIDLAMGDAAFDLLREATGGEEAPRPPAIVAFGSHIDAAALRQARELGADYALPRSAFVVQLPDLLQRHGPLTT